MYNTYIVPVAFSLEYDLKNQYCCHRRLTKLTLSRNYKLLFKIWFWAPKVNQNLLKSFP